ncbi:hypothetical protein PHYPSEUDO_015231 [Phytophthora pseudosyringae]|uniref:Uncharacterized protein n=1 Tax=Phytophthora pseudosyringae TaxID=221518 RepID=A0A8T1W3Y8_9STRA|nr:hypothetical protein PHYPSEUDO_015231 [Phytophthora pseudosyringae]
MSSDDEIDDVEAVRHENRTLGKRRRAIEHGRRVALEASDNDSNRSSDEVTNRWELKFEADFDKGQHSSVKRAHFQPKMLPDVVKAFIDEKYGGVAPPPANV